MAIIIIGAGVWGSTMAGLFNPVEPVRLWCRSVESAARVEEKLEQIAGIAERDVTVEKAFTTSIDSTDIVVLALPSAVIPDISITLKQNLKHPYPTIVSASKGLERATFKTMSQIVTSHMPEATVAVLSGPNIAKEISKGRPASCALGCEDVHVLTQLAAALGSDRCHLELTRDRVDIELCAAMKGVFAIGAGVIADRKMGCNYMGLLLTFGLHEIAEIARFLGISTTHVFGIAGVGDLVATCFSSDSRNYRLGCLLARGSTLEHALKEVNMVVEGAMTAAAVADLALLRINLPLFSAIAAIVEHPSESAVTRFERVLLDYTNAD